MKKFNLTPFIPPDKSSLIRQFLFSLLTDDKVEVTYSENFPGDIATAYNCLPFFGKTLIKKKSKIIVAGHPKKPSTVINCENSATVMHLLMGISLLKGWETILTGDRSLMARDHSDFIKAAGLYNAEIIAKDQYITLKPSKKGTSFIKTSLTRQSAQLKGFHLICMLKSGGILRYLAKTRRNTEEILNLMGADITDKDSTISVAPVKKLGGYDLPSYKDPSSSFIAACAAVITETPFTISNIYPEGLRMEPFIFMLNCGLHFPIIEKNGCFEIKSFDPITEIGEKTGISEDKVPAVIDEIPFIAYMSARNGQTFSLMGGDWLKNKESDRVVQTVERIGKIYQTEQIGSGFTIVPQEKKKAAKKMPHSEDHRMEMLSALISLDKKLPFIPGDSVSVSFPLFSKMIGELTNIQIKNRKEKILKQRKEIDKIDEKITALLSKRMDIAADIVKIKKNAGIEVFDSEREKEILKKLSLIDPSISNLVNDLYRRIFDWTKKG